jgi:carbonic anhydrase
VVSREVCICANCTNLEAGRTPDRLHRRRFLTATAATAIALAGSGTLASLAHADALTKAQRDRLSADEILALMKKGNKRFYSGKREDRDVLAQQHASAKANIRLWCC